MLQKHPEKKNTPRLPLLTKTGGASWRLAISSQLAIFGEPFISHQYRQQNPSSIDITEPLHLHDLWMRGEEGGVRADFSGANLRYLSFEGANLHDANLERANLAHADLTSANLRYANLKNACLFKASASLQRPSPDFSYANLEDAGLSYAFLDGVDFQGANLKNANLNNASLQRANLIYADLRNANLSYADLRNVNFSNAKLEGADLQGANLWCAIGNGKEIQTIQAGDHHINITDNIVWIDGSNYPWDNWMSLNIIDIKSIRKYDEDDEAISAWWQQWRPKLNQIIEERNSKKETPVVVPTL